VETRKTRCDDAQQGDPVFLKLNDAQEYTVRPVGTVVQFYRISVHTTDGRKRSVIVQADRKDEVAAMVSKGLTRQAEIEQRYALTVIDRADGKIKVMEIGTEVFEAFLLWARAADEHPGGKGGGNWRIRVEVRRGRRRFHVDFLKRVPFADSEYEAFKESRRNYTLAELFK